MTELPSSEILNIQEFSLVDLRVFLKIGRADELEAIAIGTIKKKKKIKLLDLGQLHFVVV